MLQICLKFLSFFFLLTLCHGKLPSSIAGCSRNDPNINDCIIKSVQSLQPKLASGNLGDGFQIPPMEPFRLQDIKIEPGSLLNVQMRNFHTNGGSNFKIVKLRFNFKDLVWDFVVKIPKIKMVGDYKIKARFVVLDILGDGEFETNVIDSRMRMKLFGAKYEKDGKTYLRFDKVIVRIRPGKSQIILKNLFNGDPTLGQIGNQVINEYQELFYDDFIPVIEKQFADIFKDVANQVIANATFDELFPDK